MSLLLNNFYWMSFNLMLAILAIIFGWGFITVKKGIKKLVIGFLWIIFLPNSIYLITDIEHMTKQLIQVDPIIAELIIIQYLLLLFLGLITFILALYPLERYLSKSKFKKNKILLTVLIILFNFPIAFGVILGRVDRINSWEVFTHLYRVISDTVNLLKNPSILLYVLIFGIFNNVVYFLFRNKIITWFSKRSKLFKK